MLKNLESRVSYSWLQMTLVYVSHCQHLIDQCLCDSTWKSGFKCPKKDTEQPGMHLPEKKKVFALRRMTKIEFLKIHLKSNNQVNVFFS